MRSAEPFPDGLYESPFDIALAQYIDFRPGWGAGLRELLETLEETYRVPRQQGPNQTSLDRWRDTHKRWAENVTQVSEELISTWLRIGKMPPEIRYYDFRGAIDHGRVEAALRDLRFAHYRHMRGFFGFAALPDYQDDLGPALLIETRAATDLGTFLNEGLDQPRLDSTQARNIVSYLVRETWDRTLKKRGLPAYAFANGLVARWVPEGLVASETIGFDWDGLIKGRRSLVGKHKSVQWHFGCTIRPWFAVEPQIRLTPRIIFSEDGQTVLESARRLHRLRRTVMKGWWNDRWRDVTLAFLWWLAGGQGPLILPAGTDTAIEVALPPIQMRSPVSITSPRDALTDEASLELDDPVFERDEEYDEGGSEEPDDDADAAA